MELIERFLVYKALTKGATYKKISEETGIGYSTLTNYGSRYRDISVKDKEILEKWLASKE